MLIGSVATGSGDFLTTSLHERCPGVVAHGVIANAVLTGRWWREVPGWIAVVLILIFGLAAAFIDARLQLDLVQCDHPDIGRQLSADQRSGAVRRDDADRTDRRAGVGDGGGVACVQLGEDFEVETYLASCTKTM